MDGKEQRVPLRWLTVSEASAYARVGLSEFRKVVRSGEIPSYRRGKRYTLVNTEDIDAWIRSFPSGAATMATDAKSRQEVA